MKRAALLLVALAAAAACAAPLEVARPCAGATVPLLTADQKGFLDLPRDERVEKFADAAYREKLAGFGSSPAPVELAWRGGSGGAAAVRLFLGGECVLSTNVEAASVRVYNLEAAREYSWTVTVGGETASAMFRTEDRAPRLLHVPSVKNCRDLGGRAGLRGCRVRQGRIFRTRAFNGDARQITVTNDAGQVEVVDVPGWQRVSAADREQLTGFFGVTADIDLRYDREVRGMAGSPLGPGVEWLHLPVNPYGSFGSAMSKESFARIFRVCADTARHAVAFHCSAGQDRTGAVAFALCAMLGVDEEELYKDWEATGFWNPSTSLRHETKFCKLLDLFRGYPGADWMERAEAYALSCGLTRAEIEGFRLVMLEGYGSAAGTYAIGFHRNDGAGTCSTIGFPHGTKTRTPSLANGFSWARRGYDFRGWATSLKNAEEGKIWKGDWAYVSTPVAAGGTLSAHAVWALKPNHYQIRFNCNDGTGRWRTIGFARDATLTLPSVAGLGWARPGFRFAGWATSMTKAATGRVWKSDAAKARNATAEGRTLDVYAIWTSA